MRQPLAIDFSQVTEEDFLLLRQWIGSPHVAAWWGDVDTEIALIAEHVASRDVEMFVFSVDGKPAGFIQSYSPSDWPGHGFDGEAVGTRGIDLFIGEADMIGRGIGTAVIRAFCDRLFAAGAPAVVIDPGTGNARAIRAYEKVGFRALGRFSDPQQGEILLMRLARGT